MVFTDIMFTEVEFFLFLQLGCVWMPIVFYRFQNILLLHIIVYAMFRPHWIDLLCLIQTFDRVEYIEEMSRTYLLQK